MLRSAINLQEKPHLINIARIMHEGGKYEYVLPAHWSLHLYEYHGQLRVAETAFELHPGSLTLVPPNTLMEFQIPASALHYFAHFSLPEAFGPDPTMIPIFYDVRGDVYHFEQSIITIGRSFIYRNSLLQAEVGLWNLLWELSICGEDALVGRHTILEKAVGLIDNRLGESLSVNSLAREVGVSRNHLMRLFRQERGMTVLAYVRQQRVRRARYLLENTTMPMKNIAAQINVPNLQSFSVLIKKETGHPPGYWRRHQGEQNEHL